MRKEDLGMKKWYFARFDLRSKMLTLEKNQKNAYLLA